MVDEPQGCERSPAIARGRLPYERPRLGRVHLQAEQVLATGCKTDSSGPNSGQLNACTLGPCGAIEGSS